MSTCPPKDNGHKSFICVQVTDPPGSQSTVFTEDTYSMQSTCFFIERLAHNFGQNIRHGSGVIRFSSREGNNMSKAQYSTVAGAKGEGEKGRGARG